MLKPEQEAYLAALADKGIAELAEIDTRNAQIVLDNAIEAARTEKRAQLEVAAQTLIDQGMQDFETNIAPTIKPPK